MGPASSRAPAELAGLALAAAVSVVTLTTAAGLTPAAADNTLTAGRKGRRLGAALRRHDD